MKKKETEYMHVQGMSRKNLEKLNKIAHKRPNFWETLRVVKNPRNTNAIVKALKGKSKAKYAFFLICFRRTP